MATGNFAGLYTFEEVSSIYKMDASTIRKQIKNEKFIINKEIKKFGKTWLMTEKAMIDHYGEMPLKIYNQEQLLQQLKAKKDEKIMKAASNKIKNNAIKKSKSFGNDLSCSEEDEYDPNAGWDETISGTTINSFNFGTSKSKV